LRGESDVRCVAVESQGCPKLTRGEYRYDYTDGSGVSPLQKMYTLGARFTTRGGHLGGLRYHACSKIVSALYHHQVIDAVAYPQSAVFASGRCRQDRGTPAGTGIRTRHPRRDRGGETGRRAERERVILICVSGHGLFDLSPTTTT